MVDTALAYLKLSQGLATLAQNRAEQKEPSRILSRQALYYVLSALRDSGVEKSSLKTLEELLAALDDAEAGRQNPLLRPNEYDPKAARELTIESVRFADASACVTILTEAGWTRDEAVKFVATSANFDPRDFRKKYDELRKVRRVGKDIKSRRPADFERHQQVKQLRDHRQDLSSIEFVTILLKNIAT